MPDSSVVSVGADVDLEAFRKEIEAAVAARLETGAYPADLLVELELAQDALASAVHDLSAAASFSVQPALASPHRLLGVPLSIAKRGASRGLRWYTQWLVEQLTRFSSSVVALAAAVEDRSRQQQRDLEQLRSQLTVDLADLRRQLRGRETGRLQGEVAAGLRIQELMRSAGEDDALRWSRHAAALAEAPGTVLDLACGRGELLDRLRAAGVECYGVDSRPDLVRACQERGLDARPADPLRHLESVSEGSLGGVFASQLAAELDSRRLPVLFVQAARAMVGGGILLVESLNARAVDKPALLYRDLGLAQPVHEETLLLLAEIAGFREIRLMHLPHKRPRGEAGERDDRAEPAAMALIARR
jgi:SAM-dependent methyltransferase